MARALEGAISGTLQGVSQQTPTERLAGQCSEQLNMLADPVTGVRRRPSTKYLRSLVEVGVVSTPELFTTTYDTGNGSTVLCINPATGAYAVFDTSSALVTISGVDPYFVAPAASALQSVSLGGVLYIVNTDKPVQVQVSNTGKLDPQTTGFYFVRSGAFSKAYTVQVKLGGTEYTATYTTPDGTAVGDAAKAVPERITMELRDRLLTAGVPPTSMYRTGATLFIKDSAGPVVVTSDSGSSYILASTSSNVPLETDLPPYLDPVADGALCSVGTGAQTIVWYQYKDSTRTWVEVGAYGSPSGITSTSSPRKLDSSGMGVFAIEGRLAGDDVTNESPAFIRDGLITGLGVYQGRLIILSGAYVSASAAGKPARFYRSTVTSLLPSDRIDIASGSSQNATFRQAVQFNRDLVLLGDTVQAVIPAGQTLLTPETASIVLTSDVVCDSSIRPTGTMQTLLYPSPRSAQYAAVLELVPSQYTSSQYLTQDITTHIPKYLQGRVRLTAGATNAGIAVFGVSGNLSDLVVHQYHFNADGKAQQAWYKWDFPYPVLSAEFTRTGMYLVVKVGTGAAVMFMDVRVGGAGLTGEQSAFVDAYAEVDVVDGVVSIPAHLVGALPDKLLLVHSAGTMLGESVGIKEISGATLTTVAPITSSTMLLGFKYRSLYAPTPPVLRDQNDIAIGTERVGLLRYILNTQNTGEFYVRVQDATRGVDYTNKVSAVPMNSPMLYPDAAIRADRGSVTIPCRTTAESTHLSVFTESGAELNVLTLEYILKHNQRRRRL